MKTQTLRQFLETQGGTTHVSKMLGVSRNTVNNWCSFNTMPPPEILVMFHSWSQESFSITEHTYRFCLENKIASPSWLVPPKFETDRSVKDHLCSTWKPVSIEGRVSHEWKTEYNCKTRRVDGHAEIVSLPSKAIIDHEAIMRGRFPVVTSIDEGTKDGDYTCKLTAEVTPRGLSILEREIVLRGTGSKDSVDSQKKFLDTDNEIEKQARFLESVSTKELEDVLKIEEQDRPHGPRATIFGIPVDRAVFMIKAELHSRKEKYQEHNVPLEDHVHE